MFHLARVQRILCLGAHADDIEIGCGGTLLRLLAEAQREVHWVVFSGTSDRAEEARASAKSFLRDASKCSVELHDFPDGHFPQHYGELKKQMAALASGYQPDLVLTHRLEDRHQDHRTLSELTWNHFRRQAIWEYEIPKYEGDLTTPNLYVDLTESTCLKKIDLIATHFATQRCKEWFDRETFWSLLRLRGIESHRRSGFAEGFTARKIMV